MSKPKSRQSKKVLFVTSTFPSHDSDPVPAFVKDEAIWLSKKYPHIEVTVLAPHNAYSNTSSYKKHSEYEEYRFHYFFPFKWEKLAGRGIQPALRKNKFLYLQLPFLFIAEFWALLSITIKEKPDIIYAHWFTPQAITTALVSKITRTPFVFDTQASDVIVLKKIPLSKILVNHICKSALAYTAPSRQTADKLLYFIYPKNKAIVEQKLKLIPMGASPIAPDIIAVSNASKKYNLKNKKVIFFMGRLVDRKGVDDLLKAFYEIQKAGRNLRLIIAGDGQDREIFMRLAEKLGVQDKVVFTGYISGEQKAALLSLADIVAVPSVNVGDNAEGLPIVFMEAVLANKITVISDATGAHEVVESGVNSFVFEAGNIKDLERNIILALKCKDQTKFRQEVSSLAKRFNWESIIQQRAEALHLA